MATQKQTRLKRLIRLLKHGKTLRQLGREIGVVHSTVGAWERGKLGAEGREKISAYLGVSSDRLNQYLEGDCTLEELMQGTSRVSFVEDGLTIEKVVRWVSTLSLSDLMLLLREIATVVMRVANPTSEVTIANLVNDVDLGELAEETQIPIERLQAIAEGQRPDDSELVDLATALLKDNDEPWTTHELMEIRDRTFHLVEEKQPNGK